MLGKNADEHEISMEVTGKTFNSLRIVNILISISAAVMH